MGERFSPRLVERFKAALRSACVEVLNDAGEVLIRFEFASPPTFDPDRGLLHFPALKPGMVGRNGVPVSYRITAGEGLTLAKGLAGPRERVRISIPEGFDQLLIGMQVRSPVANITGEVKALREVAP